MRIDIVVPFLLADCTGGKSGFSLEADTLEEAIQGLFAEYPLLRHHVYNEEGQIRQHVLLYYNDENIEWLDNRQIPLQTGDRLLVLQAVSGG
ncbi:MoaD/ThiS family protein [Paenibacillus mendelii]|uniref:MoaD/ThiS family protein n=1 Tax=Paenibacillus mendelii TaxID=206163 RepID=A0ABV6JJB1_9BACL|nr:MoaD/ThiS family protein [Paenibacillus mendelii]MCQ6558930.1 MoaD/ThiS family protein [Paenibacillus mendelii]